ncbi:MAG: DUF4038 domain-containing protein [Armatimonadetes bacterium]|nr:DUF4038 domain-containing protein [Armatimonadota bacterium]
MGPLRVSANGRYFTDELGSPFFWLGDTQWQLCRDLPLEDVPEVLDDRRRRGFSVLQVMLTGVGDGTQPNVAGYRPWLGDDPATPDERYLEHVEAVLELARESGLVIALGVYHQLHESRITVANARAHARSLAIRFGEVPHLVWSMYPRAEARFVPVVRELAAGLQEGDGGRHPITVHPDPSPASSSFLSPNEAEGWLAFHSIQTWADTHLIVPMVMHDYQLQPARPVVMAEGAYEAGQEYGFEVTPLWVRWQAYWTVLAGGHHSYGHNDLWRLPPHWREALKAPGAAQLTILRQVLTERREWWNLVPDQSLIAAPTDLPIAARSQAGDWALVYLAAGGAVSLNLDRLSPPGTLSACWIDPVTGEAVTMGSVSGARVEEFRAPDAWEDALLLLERAPCSRRPEGRV